MALFDDFGKLGRSAVDYLRRSLDAIAPTGQNIERPRDPVVDHTIQVPMQRSGLGPVTGWTIDGVRSALAMMSAGNFGASGILSDDFLLHPVFAKCIHERGNIFSILPRCVTEARKRDRQAAFVADWFREIRAEVYSDAILRDIHRDCLQMGFAVVGMDWEERRDGRHRWWLPVLKPWHPSLVTYFYRGIGRSIDGGSFNATTLNKGLLSVQPGMGRWMLVTRGSRQPWIHGAVHSLGQDWIGDQNNFFDNLAFEERFGMGVMSYSHDETYQRGQVNQSVNAISRMGAAAVIPLRMRAGVALEKLELLATSGSGWQAFDQTEKRILTRTLLYYLGQDLTSVGQSGGLGQEQAVVHKDTLWSKHEESCSWFLDGERVVERDEYGEDVVYWRPTDGEIYKQVSRWIGWFNFRNWDIMPRFWLDATPPDQKKVREERSAKRGDEKAKTIVALGGGMDAIVKAFPDIAPAAWARMAGVLAENAPGDKVQKALAEPKPSVPKPGEPKPTAPAEPKPGEPNPDSAE